MYIKVSEIPSGGLDVFAAKGRASIPGILEGMNLSPLISLLLTSAELTLTFEKGDIFAEGLFDAEGEAACDRCSDTIPVRFGKSFHTVLVRRENNSTPGPVELRAEDLEVEYFDGKGVEINDIFWEQVALEIPVKVICSEECKGICPICGVNRNRESCSCETDDSPGPFDVLKNLKGKK